MVMLMVLLMGLLLGLLVEKHNNGDANCVANGVAGHGNANVGDIHNIHNVASLS